MRRLLIAAAFLLAMPAVAQVRYEITPNGQGYTRLDTRTGAVSHCDKRDDGLWFCEPVTRNTGLDPSLARLGATAEALAADVAALSARIDEIAAGLADLSSRRPVDLAPLAEADARHDAEIAALGEQLATISANVDAMGERLDALTTEAPAPQVASQTPSFAEEVVRRLFAMVRTLKGEATAST